MTRLRILLLALLFGLPLAPARAADAGGPRAFMAQVFDRASWDDLQGRVTLVLRNARGDEKVRRIDMWSKKNARGESRMLMSFVEPADVRGTAFLLIEHERGEDDRRLWLPALRRVQRISASGAGGHFMSSDFTYYDVGRPELEDWTYREVGERAENGTPCRLIEGNAATAKVRKDTGYGRIVWCVDPARKVVLAADYFDADGEPLKTLRALRFEEVGGTPFAVHMRMRDVTGAHESEMTFSELKVDQGVDEARFTERGLRRAGR